MQDLAQSYSDWELSYRHLIPGKTSWWAAVFLVRRDYIPTYLESFPAPAGYAWYCTAEQFLFEPEHIVSLFPMSAAAKVVQFYASDPGLLAAAIQDAAEAAVG